MDSKRKVTISWSGGKDSAFALHQILRSGNLQVVSLHTVFNEETRRVGMHGVSESLIEAQAGALNIPLKKLFLNSSETHEAYHQLMSKFYADCASQGLDGVVFGDIFLEDLRVYRETLLQPAGLSSFYPLWKMNTKALVNDFIDSGFKTVICAANALYFQSNDLGKTIDHQFVNMLPLEVDPCGENGEFHTFVYDSPDFNNTIAFNFGEVIQREYSFAKTNEHGEIELIKSAFRFQELLLRID